MPSKKELNKIERINAEIERLNEFYKNIDADRIRVARELIPRTAYMLVTLEDMEADLDEHGFYELFTQSDKTDPYERERPVARQYNQISKNYQSIIKQLSDLLPDTEVEEEDDGFADFMKRADS